MRDRGPADRQRAVIRSVGPDRNGLVECARAARQAVNARVLGRDHRDRISRSSLDPRDVVDDREPFARLEHLHVEVHDSAGPGGYHCAGVDGQPVGHLAAIIDIQETVQLDFGPRGGSARPQLDFAEGPDRHIGDQPVRPGELAAAVRPLDLRSGIEIDIQITSVGNSQSGRRSTAADQHPTAGTHLRADRRSAAPDGFIPAVQHRRVPRSPAGRDIQHGGGIDGGAVRRTGVDQSGPTRGKDVGAHGKAVIQHRHRRSGRDDGTGQCPAGTDLRLAAAGDSDDVRGPARNTQDAVVLDVHVARQTAGLDIQSRVPTQAPVGRHRRYDTPLGDIHIALIGSVQNGAAGNIQLAVVMDIEAAADSAITHDHPAAGIDMDLRGDPVIVQPPAAADMDVSRAAVGVDLHSAALVHQAA